MSANESTRISAAAGMMLNNQRIGRRSRPNKLAIRSEAIQDTLETTDGDTSGGRMVTDQNTAAEAETVTDSVLPGDVLDISG